MCNLDKLLVRICAFFITVPCFAQNELPAIPKCVSPDSVISFTDNTRYKSLRSPGDINGDGFDELHLNYYDYNADIYKSLLLYGSKSGYREPVNFPFICCDMENYIPAGDIIKDGFDDIFFYTKNEIKLHRGSISGIEEKAAMTFIFSEDPTARINSGFSNVDINNDGFIDLVLSINETINSIKNNVIQVYFGSLKGMDTVPFSMISTDFRPLQELVLNAHDVNHDGFSDIFSFGGKDNNTLGMVYLGSPGGLDTIGYKILLPDFYFPDMHVEFIGDVNGDQFGDMILSGGEVFGTSGELAFIYYGNAAGIDSMFSWQTILEGFIKPPTDFGKFVGSAGDINKDGLNDFFVGGSLPSTTRVFLGRPGGPSRRADFWLDVPVGSLINAGDINGDGYPDLAGWNWSEYEEADTARVNIFYGNGKGYLNSYECATAVHKGILFPGVIASAAGDMNGDGYDDIVSGISWDNEEANARGLAFLNFGSPLGLKNDWVKAGVEHDEYFGEIVSSAGDVNGDGFADIMITAPEYKRIIDKKMLSRGRVDIFYGSPSEIKKEPGTSLYGYGLGFAGDMNQDGYDDLAGYSDDSLVLFFGTAKGLDTIPRWRTSFQSWLQTIKGGADINKDGFPDIMIEKRDSIFIFYGNGHGFSDIADKILLGNRGSFVGDVNHDGFTDLMYYNNESGNFELDYGSPGGPVYSGWSNPEILRASYAGDFNHDGFDDVMLEKPFELFGPPYGGTVAIIFGSPSGLQQNPGWTAGDKYGPGIV